MGSHDSGCRAVAGRPEESPGAWPWRSSHGGPGPCTAWHCHSFPKVRAETSPWLEHTWSHERSGYRELLADLLCERRLEMCYRYWDYFGLVRKAAPPVGAVVWKPALDFSSQVWKSKDARTGEIQQELKRHWLCSPSLQPLLRVGWCCLALLVSMQNGSLSKGLGLLKASGVNSWIAWDLTFPVLPNQGMLWDILQDFVHTFLCSLLQTHLAQADLTWIFITDTN